MEKLSKKELKTPDRIWIASRDLVAWAADQWAILAICAGLIFVAIIAVTLVLQFQTKAEGEAQFAYSKAQALFQQAQIGSLTEKADLKKDLQAELDKLSSQYSSSKANGMASLLRGQLLMSEKKFAEAAAEFEKFRSALPRRDRELGAYPLGIALEQAGKFEEALKAFDEIAANEESGLRAEALLGKGRVQKSLNRQEDARKTYSLFLEKFPQNADAATVRGLLAELK